MTARPDASIRPDAPLRADATLRLERHPFFMPDVGLKNPLPMVNTPPDSPYRMTGDLPQEIIDRAGYGHPANLYPYRLQDGYDRTRSEHELDTVVLENKQLRAVFIPGLGGRLWELFDKSAGKHLLHTPRDIRFANLALRNAWFAGGIEWNIGTRGHSPTTCSPMHAGRLRTADGHEVLRMWEFDRLREVVFQLDIWLPPESAVLLVRIRIRNPNADAVPMYWWTNAAVPEDAGSRVIAPADSAFASDYAGNVSRVAPADDGGVDCTWPSRNPHARDFFFDLDAAQRRWILNTDQDGDGLAMLSTDRLRGRKLFVWGSGPGGRRWQEWLSDSEGAYAEIQAGLAQTQYEHLRMPAGAEWSWVEAYGNARVDPVVAHGGDWQAAVHEGEDRVDDLVSREDLAAAESAAAGWADAAPERMLSSGTGWGALESARRRASRMPWIDETGTPFPRESITDEQQPWLDLLDGHGFAGAYSDVAGADWEDLLSTQPGAASLVHRAVLLHARGDVGTAERLYGEVLASDGVSRSLSSSEGAAGHTGRLTSTSSGSDTRFPPGDRQALAHRGLALIALARERVDEAVTEYRSACAGDQTNRALLVEAASALVATEHPNYALALIDRADDELARHGRVRFLRALALARSGRRDEAAGILKAGLEVADLREGENSITALWLEACPGEPVPAAYQFSMHDG